jgi:hypothetical protein
MMVIVRGVVKILFTYWCDFEEHFPDDLPLQAHQLLWDTPNSNWEQTIF